MVAIRRTRSRSTHPSLVKERGSGQFDRKVVRRRKSLLDLYLGGPPGFLRRMYAYRGDP